MKRIFTFILVFFLISGLAFAGQVVNPFTGKQDIIPTITEEDGSPSIVNCKTLKFANGNVTDNGDTTCSIGDSTSIGGGGGSIELEVSNVSIGTTFTRLDRKSVV